MQLDYVSAYVWYQAAASGGEMRASAKLKELSHVMTAKQLSIARSRVADVHPRESPGQAVGEFPANAAVGAPPKQR